MTRQQKLTKLIEIAVDNGWEVWPTLENGLGGYDPYYEYECFYEIIFSHDFAKAIWGEECAFCPTRGHAPCVPNWKHHLREAVIDKDPLEYYHRNYDNKRKKKLLEKSRKSERNSKKVEEEQS
jgi:hypothetical protein